MQIIFFIFQLTNLAVFGLILARRLMPKENRLVILLPFGGLISTCCYVWLLSWVGLLTALPVTIVVVNGLIAFGSGFLIWRTRLNLTADWHWVKNWQIGLSPSGLILMGLSLIFMAAYAVACVRLNQLGIGYGEPQFIQQGFTSSILRGNYPPVSPFEPDYPLLYHWIYNLWAAGLAKTAGVGSAGGILISTIWLSVLLWWGGFAFFYRQTGGPLRSLIAAWLLVAANNTSWLDDFHNLSSLAPGDIISWLNERTRPQLLIANNLDNIFYNYTIPFGYMAFVACLWCYLELAQAKTFQKLAFGLTCITLAIVIGSSEALTGGLAAAIVGLPLLKWLASYRLKWRAIKSDWRSLALPIALLVVGLIASWPVQSVITNIFDRAGGKIELTFTEHPGFMVGNLRSFYSIFSWFFVMQTGGLVLLILPVLYLYWRGYQTRLITILLLAGLAIFVFSVLFYPKLYPPDNSRFFAAWYCLTVIGVFLALMRIYDHTPQKWLKYGTLGLTVVLSIVWIGPGVIAALPRTVNPVAASCFSNADEAAALLIAKTARYDERILVVPGPQGYYQQYNGGFYTCNRAALMGRMVMQYSGGPIPLGFTLYNHIEEYRPQYVRTMEQLDEADLRQLKIGLLYVDPNELSDHQKSKIAELKQQGRLELLGEFAGKFSGPADSPTAYPSDALLVRQVYRLKW